MVLGKEKSSHHCNSINTSMINLTNLVEFASIFLPFETTLVSLREYGGNSNYYIHTRKMCVKKRISINYYHKRLQMILGEPDLQVWLFRLLKNWHKQREHFKEYLEKLRELLLNYFLELELIDDWEKNYKLKKIELIHDYLATIIKCSLNTLSERIINYF